MAWFIQHGQAWLISAAILLLTTGLALLAHRLFFSLFRRLAERTGKVAHHALVEHGRRPAQWIAPLLAVVVVLPVLPLRSEVLHSAQHFAGLVLIASVAWGVIVVSEVLADVAAARYRVDVADNLTARRIRTQIQVMRRILIVVVTILTLGIMLMTFPSIRQLGTSLLASAGLAGLVVGMAMKPTISSLLAGIQIALTEPIRIDDVVIVDGEWGRIEEITTTYVVVRIWDLRRMVVPLSYFIEHPFENWTRVTADMMGTVFLFVDYSVPVEEVRHELGLVLESSGLWDGKVCELQVTDATEHAVQLRALLSASDSSKVWDLRCYVREKLVAFLQERYPGSLPRARTEIHGLPGGFGVSARAGRHGSAQIS